MGKSRNVRNATGEVWGKRPVRKRFSLERRPPLTRHVEGPRRRCDSNGRMVATCKNVHGDNERRITIERARSRRFAWKGGVESRTAIRASSGKRTVEGG